MIGPFTSTNLTKQPELLTPNFCHVYYLNFKHNVWSSTVFEVPIVLQTLSSLALVFALHHYKPTPLYVMDEIDAALGKSLQPFSLPILSVIPSD